MAKSGAERQAEYRARRAQEIEALRASRNENEASSRNEPSRNEPLRDRQELEAEIGSLRKQVEHMKRLVAIQGHELAAKDEALKRARAGNFRRKLDPAELKLLLGFVHPDRHPGNEERARRAFLIVRKLEASGVVKKTKPPEEAEPSRNETPSRNEQPSRNEAREIA